MIELRLKFDENNALERDLNFTPLNSKFWGLSKCKIKKLVSDKIKVF